MLAPRHNSTEDVLPATVAEETHECLCLFPSGLGWKTTIGFEMFAAMTLSKLVVGQSCAKLLCFILSEIETTRTVDKFAT